MATNYAASTRTQLRDQGNESRRADAWDRPNMLWCSSRGVRANIGRCPTLYHGIVEVTETLEM